MILSSTSPYALLKEFSIACGFKYDAVFFVFCRKIQTKKHDFVGLIPNMTTEPPTNTFLEPLVNDLLNAYGIMVLSLLVAIE